MHSNRNKTSTNDRAVLEAAADAQLEQWIERMREAQPVLDEEETALPLRMSFQKGPSRQHWQSLRYPLNPSLLAAACLLGAVWMLEVNNPTLENPQPVESKALLLSGYTSKNGLSTAKSPTERLLKQQQNEEANRAFRKTNQRLNRL